MEDIRIVNVRGTQYSIASQANENMAPIEDGDTASQAYARNKFMVFKGYLCKTTATIAQGDTLAVGTNLAYDTIAEEIEGLSDGIGGTTDTFRFGTDGNGEYGYIKKVGGADTFFPFKTKHTETVTPTSRAQVDMGEYHKNRYVTLTSVPNNNTTTYSATTRGASLDMGATNTHRYVNTNGVPNANSTTYSVTTNGTHDMGATNTHRYVNTSVTSAAAAPTLKNSAQNVREISVTASDINMYKAVIAFNGSTNVAYYSMVNGVLTPIELNDPSYFFCDVSGNTVTAHSVRYATSTIWLWVV